MEHPNGFLMDEPTWSQRVKTVRLRLDVTQAGLARRLDTHENTVAQWELRDRRPYSAEAEKFLELELELETEEAS